MLQQCCDARAASCLSSRAMGGKDLGLFPRHSVNLKSAPGTPQWCLNLSLCLFSTDLTQDLS